LSSNSKELFVEALKAEYNAQFELKNSLEAKSGQLITVCGIVIPLLFGFSSLLVDKSFNKQVLLFSLEVVLVIIITLEAASIFLSVWALRIQIYRHAFLPNAFFTEDKKGRLIDLVEKEVNEFGKKDSEEIYDILIKEFLLSNKENLYQNDIKATKIQIAQYLFLIGLAMVPILVGILFSYPPIKT